MQLLNLIFLAACECYERSIPSGLSLLDWFCATGGFSAHYFEESDWEAAKYLGKIKFENNSYVCNQSIFWWKLICIFAGLCHIQTLGTA